MGIEKRIVLGNNRKLDIANAYQIGNFANEDTLNLDRCVESVGNASTRIFSCSSYFKMANTPMQGDLPLEEIGQQAGLDAIQVMIHGVNGLYPKAYALRASETNYVTGVKMFYGYNTATSKLFLIYQPVLFVKEADLDQNILIRSYIIKEEKSGVPKKYFTFNKQEQKFEEIPALNFQTYCDNYTSNVFIRHFETGNTFSGHIAILDAKCAIFSFQLLFNLVYDNLPTKKELVIFNSVLLEKHHPHIDIWHGLILSPDLTPVQQPLDEEMIVGVFQGVFANLAHLCPPNCKIIYRLEQ